MKPEKKRQTMADKAAQFEVFGNKIGYTLEFKYVENVVRRSKEQWFSLTGRKIWRHAKKNIRKGDPNHHSRLKKSKSRMFGKPFEYKGNKLSKSLMYARDATTDTLLIGPQGNPNAHKNILSGIPRKHNINDGRKMTPLSVLIFGGRSTQADREPDEDDDRADKRIFGRGTQGVMELIPVKEWADKGRPKTNIKVTPRPFMQLAFWKVMQQKETIKNFKLKP